MYNLVIFGAPGSGKGTQSDKIKEKYHIYHLSTGDMLREEMANHTELGNKSKQYMDSGKLVPDELVIAMVESVLFHTERKSQGFILDGFPRTIEQAKALDIMLGKNHSKIDQVLFLNVPEEVLITRIAIRSETSKRSDDTDSDIIKQRISEYRTKTEPVLNFYKEQEKFREVKGVGTIDEIFANICLAIDSLKVK